jgi:SAM-dependent methyltransferase
MTTRQRFDMQAAWDTASAAFLMRRDPTTTTITYGNLSPTESEVRLLGDLRGRTVLDLGCGGGHNTVACARAGAQVTAIDPSYRQLAAARRLTAQHSVAVDLHQGTAALLPKLGRVFDLVLAIQTLPYVDDLPQTLAACRGALTPSGRMVVSLDHPVRDCFFDEEAADLAAFPVRSYHDTAPLVWSFGASALMRSRHLPLAGWLAAFTEAGLRLGQLTEPPAPSDLLDELWPADGPLAPLRAIPHTLIMVLTRA